MDTIIPHLQAIDSPQPVLCSLDGRRSNGEVISKYLIVHFTVIVGLLQLRSLQREKWQWSGLVFFIICPLVIFVRQAAAILVTLAAALYWRIRPNPESGHAFRRAPIWIWGQLPSDEPSEAQFLPINGADNPRKEFGWKHLGKAAVAGALIIQSCGTIYIYHRRLEKSATTFADDSVFRLGCAGLLIGFISVLMILDIPWLGSGIQPQSDRYGLATNDLTWLDLTLICIRGVYLEDYEILHASAPEKVPWELTFAVHAMLATIPIQFVSHFRILIGICTFHWRDLPSVTMAEILPESNVGRLAPVAAGGFTVWIVALLAGFMMKSVAKQPGTMRKLVRIAAFIGIYLILVPIVLPAISVLLLFALYTPFVDLAYWVGSVLDIIFQLSELKIWPVDMACPLLWSDPDANFLWQLA
jgi:hypothetical protein